MSPLTDLQKRYGTLFRVEELTHGNKKKTDRVMWALQGRFENGFVSINKGEWNNRFLDQLFQFPWQQEGKNTLFSNQPVVCKLKQLVKMRFSGAKTMYGCKSST